MLHQWDYWLAQRCGHQSPCNDRTRDDRWSGRSDLPERDSVVWGPMFHIAGTDNIMMTLLHGGSIILMEGYDPAEIVRLMVRQPVGILPLMPATITPLLEELNRTAARPQSLLRVGNYVDLVRQTRSRRSRRDCRHRFAIRLDRRRPGWLRPARAHFRRHEADPFLESAKLAMRGSSVNDQGMDVEDGRAGRSCRARTKPL